jgi:hypothetical protein
MEKAGIGNSNICFLFLFFCLCVCNINMHISTEGHLEWAFGNDMLSQVDHVSIIENCS